MKRTAKILPVLILAILMMAGQTFAATGDSYSYRINIFSGNEGTFADGSKQITLTCAAGERVSLDTSQLDVRCGSDRYFIKGIKEAGDDNSSRSLVRSLIVKADEDKDYVISYGLKKEKVEYTVKYKDAKGRKLLQDDRYFGVVGDKPVVSYKYVEGYIPTAYNETKTLVEDSARNVFVFIYKKAGANGQINGSSEGSSSDNGANSGSSGSAAAGNNAGGTLQDQGQLTVAQAGVLDNRNPAQAADQGNDNNGAQNTENGGQPQELVDLDDNEVPLADGSGNGGSEPGFNGGQILIIAGAAFAAAALLALIARKRKGSAEE